MRRSTLIMVVVLLAASLFGIACETTTNTNLSTPTPTRTPTPTPTPTLTPAPTPDPTESYELNRAKTLKFIDYSWAGAGTSTKMKLTVTNKTAQPVIAHGELGTKLEPANGNVQSMVVTREFEVELEPNEKKETEVDVACLDISLPPPGVGDTSWKVSVSPELKKFITCVNGIERVKSASRAEQETAVQYLLWNARGASMENWIDFLVKYGKSADGKKFQEDEARGEAENINRISVELARNCPPLENP